jgi:hypothetical protein
VTGVATIARIPDVGVSGWQALGIAVAGGAAASLVTLGVYFWTRVSGAWHEIWAHERSAQERDQDLESWVADRSILLKRQLREITAEHNRHKDDSTSFHSSAHAYDLAEAKEQALHEYRDQERQALRDVMRIRESEGLAHLFWRSQVGLRPPELTGPDRVQEMLDFWRSSVTRHQAEPVEVRDPTRETFETTLAELNGDPDAFR